MQQIYLKIFDLRLDKEKPIERRELFDEGMTTFKDGKISFSELVRSAEMWLQENLSEDELIEFDKLTTFPARDCIHVGSFGIPEIWFTSYETSKKYFFTIVEIPF